MPCRSPHRGPCRVSIRWYHRCVGAQSGEVAPFEERTAEDIERRRAAKEAAIAAQKKPPPKVFKSRTRKRVSKAVKSLMASKALRGFSTMKK